MIKSIVKARAINPTTTILNIDLIKFIIEKIIDNIVCFIINENFSSIDSFSLSTCAILFKKGRIDKTSASDEQTIDITRYLSSSPNTKREKDIIAIYFDNDNIVFFIM